MRFYNCDGTMGEMCGNGARCIARYGYEKGLTGEIQHIETTAGEVIGWRQDKRYYKIRLNNVTAVLIAVLGGVVMSGVPGGGLIGEMLICNIYGFPPEAFPIVAAIGFLVDPPATMINASGDAVASMMVTRLVEGKDWLKKRVTSEEVKL